MKTQLTKLLENIGQIKLSRMGYWVVYPEVYADANCGVLDVAGAMLKHSIGVGSNVETIGIEIKVTRGDYFSRKQKMLDKHSRFIAKEEELGANYRYFFTPKGLIKKEELYEGWGLMEWDGKKVLMTIKAPRKEVDNTIILYWMARQPLYVYHENHTKLMSGYAWKNYPDTASGVSKEDTKVDKT